MKIRDLFNYVHKLKEDPFEDSELLMWLNEVEGLVHTKVFLLAPSEYKEITADDIDSDTFKLLIVGPHQKIYPAYLVAMIDFANGEYNRYANTLEMFNAHFTELQMWQRQYAGPADGECVFRGYYLSAYGIAKNRGVFNGSEEEWLASLKGDKGDSAYDIAVKLGYRGTEQEWIAYLEMAQSLKIEEALQTAHLDLNSHCDSIGSELGSIKYYSIAEIEEAKNGSLTEIAEAKNGSLTEIAEAKNGSLTEIAQAQSASIKDIAEAKNGSISDITREYHDKINKINLAAGIVQTPGNDETKVMSQKASSNAFSSALKGTASGEAIAITDASPVEHEMGIKIRGKNILPYPYSRSGSHTANGITFTPNEDRSITISGVATGTVYYALWNANLGSRSMVGSANGGTNGDYAFSPFVNYSASNKNVSLYVANGTDLSTPVTVYPQIEKGTTATAYTPYIEDISTVKVKKYGKNLADIYGFSAEGLKTPEGKRSLTNNYGTTISTTEPSNSVVITQTQAPGSGTTYTNGFVIIGLYNKLKEGDSITFSFDLEITNNPLNAKYMGASLNGDSMRSFTFANGRCAWTFPWTAGGGRQTIEIRIAGCSCVISNIQLEMGNTATEYEPFNGMVEYPVLADGTVEGVTPIYPTTTLMTDTAGAVIDCTYNRDINKAFEELYNAIISTGGNV